MTDTFFSAVCWCIAQVTVVAAVGIVASQLLVRIRPFAACTMVCMAAVVAAMLTLLAPLPAHNWFILKTHSVSARPEIVRQLPSDRIQLPTSFGPDNTSLSSDSLFDLRQLRVGLRVFFANTRLNERGENLIVQNVAWLLPVIVGLGIMRLIAELAFVAKLRRRGTPVCDPSLTDLIRKFAVDLDLRPTPEIREYLDFDDAAAAGWLRPMLILPRNWRRWSENERRSVIAHELVHIARQDAFSRTVASTVLALHFYNPLVHWLVRRVMLYQEFTADALASSIVGRKTYLHSLSSLALRRDDQLTKCVSPDVLPVFSGKLIMRIKVLQSKEGTIKMKSGRGRDVTSAMISMAFIVLGISALAVRGIAQSEERKETTPNALNVFTELPNVVDRDFLEPESFRGTFNRSPLDPSVVGEKNRFGMSVFRMNEFLNRPEIQSQIPVFNAALSAALKTDLKLNVAPAISVENVDWIAGRPCVTLSPKTKVKRGQLMFGIGGFTIKLKKPLNLSQWVEQFAPETKHRVLEGNDVFEFTLTAFGPLPIFFWMPDDTTIRTSIMDERSVKIVKMSDLNQNPPTRPNQPPASNPLLVTNYAKSSNEQDIPRWSATWKRIDRGIFSAALSKIDASKFLSEIDNNPEVQGEMGDELVSSLRGLLSRNVEPFFSFDVAKNPSQMLLQFGLSFPSREDAIESEHDIQNLIGIAKKELEKESGDSSNRERQTENLESQMYYEALGAVTTSIREYRDHTADLMIFTSIPFAKMTQSFGIPTMAEEPSTTERR